jgi:TolA-binding protein
MLKGIVVFFALLIGGMIWFQGSLQDGSFLRYLDLHQDKPWAPRVAYTVGQGYYLFQDLPQATTYFLRVAQRYPETPLGEDAYFHYLQCLDDMASVPRATLAEGYQAFLDRYPRSERAEVVRNRLDAIRSNR